MVLRLALPDFVPACESGVGEVSAVVRSFSLLGNRGCDLSERSGELSAGDVPLDLTLALWVLGAQHTALLCISGDAYGAYVGESAVLEAVEVGEVIWLGCEENLVAPRPALLDEAGVVPDALPH